METRRLRRAAALLGLPLGMGVRTAAGSVRVRRGGDQAQVRADVRRANARAVRSTLGGLRGGALKAGQLVSTVDSLFPADPDGTWTQALTSLQESATSVPFADVAPVLAAELGPRWSGWLTDVDPVPVAAASLGQVHRARLEGRAVAVKVQYPGVREAVVSDLRMLGWALHAGAVASRGLSVPPIMAQMRTQLAGELDYVAEGAHQDAFATAYAQDPEVVVPAVHVATPRVLVTDWLPGRPLVAAVDDDATARDAIALRYQRFLLSGPQRAGLLHADPHPGNFRVMDDGRLGVLDFGAVLPLPSGMPESFGRLMRVMTSQDPSEVSAGLRREGFVRPGADVDVHRLASFLAPFSEPAREESFHYSPEWLRSMFTRGPDDPRDPDYAVAMRLTIPPEQLLTHRVWLGCVGVLCRLRATVPVRAELERWLPGFDGAPARR